MTIEQQLARLDAIVTQLESEEIDIARSLALFEEGVACLREAAGALSEAETRVQRLSELADGAFVVDSLDDDD